MVSQVKNSGRDNVPIDPYKEPTDTSPPAFWSPLSERDASLLKKMNSRRRFDISIVYAVAARCSYGFPQVLVCRPQRKGGSPFPTMFWLTCPYLDHRSGELESLQKVAELEEILKSKETEVKNWHEQYARLRKLISGGNIDIPTGVGGINWHEAPHAAKCLHLQAATLLGWRYHPAADWLVSEFGEMECSCGICSKYDFCCENV